MKAVVQRVSRAAVRVAGVERAAIGAGFLVLLGVATTDSAADAAWMASKLARLRLFADAAGRLNLSLADTGGSALIVSQFTLLGDATRGNRPSFTTAAPGPLAEQLYLTVVKRLREEGIPVTTGAFGASMEVELINDGPVTVILESPGR